MSAAKDGQAVAVVGMACRFPGARDVDQYWANLVRGDSALTRADDAELTAAGVPEEVRRHPDHVPVAGRLDGFDLFDAEYFGISPAEAAAMDPQQRLFLQEAVHALEDAGWTPASGRRVGVFCGSGDNAYAGLLDRPDRPAVPDSPATLPLRVSYHLDLRGPSVFVSSLCSTALTAVHLARRSLLSGECDLALAGAVTVRLPLHHGYLAHPGGVASPQGTLHPFDHRASGTVPGSGVGAVVLKRLEHALRDGDTVHAVIRGSALNNDGAGRQSFAAPGVQGQQDVILAALADSGIEPDSIGYVEAHGTGTPLGDPVEIAALTGARERLGVTTPCVIGAVKSSVGHLDSAAGMAGLVKAVLAVREGVIPPTVGHDEPNPRIRLDGTGLRVSGRTEPWPVPGGPRRAAVTALGIGGTNAHLVVEEPPGDTTDGPGPDGPERSLADAQDGAEQAWLFPVSARSPQAFGRLCGLLGERAGSFPEGDVARSLQRHRAAHPLRRAWVASSGAKLAAELRAAVAPLPRQPVTVTVDPRAARTAGLDPRLPERLPALRAALAPFRGTGSAAEWFGAALWALDALAGVATLVGAGAGEYLALAAAGGLPADVAVRCALLHTEAVAAAEPGADLSACERLLSALEKELAAVAFRPLTRQVRSAHSGEPLGVGEVSSADRLLDMTRGEVLGAEPGEPPVGAPELFAGLGSWGAWLSLVAHCWERGVDVSWEIVHGPVGTRAAPLPSYPFGEVRHWAAASPRPAAPAPGAARPPVEPELSPLEHLAAIWREVLGVSEARPDDSFFQLGGHSLLASQVMARIWERLEIRVSLGDLLEAETLGAMARLVEERQAAARLFTALAPTETGERIGTIEL
ncbi:beta-ketoacyl synthase N-terminal-like domain-containing protein [Streptomyces sp. CPS1]